MKQGIYTGPIEHLQGQTALLRDTEPFDQDKVLAQFDNHDAELDGEFLAFGWHEFERDDFLEFGVRE